MPQHTDNSAHPRRIRCVDQARALAILGMIFVHFGEGAATRIGLPAALSDLALAVGRMATPGFVCIFGFAVGLAYSQKFGSEHRGVVSRRLIARAAALAGCVLLVRFDRTLDLVAARELDPVQWVWQTYSILTFYCVALFTVPLFLRLFDRRGWAWPVGVGLGMWALGTALVWRWWPDGGADWHRVIRLFLVSGPYPYLQLMGTAVLMMPLGAWIKRSHREGTLDRTMAVLAGGGLFVCLGSLAYAFGREAAVDIAGLAHGTFKAPTRPWYFGFYGGATIVLTAGLYLANRARPDSQAGLVFALLGRSALTVYVGQALLQPALESIDTMIAVEGLVRVALPLAVLTLLLVLVVLRHLPAAAAVTLTGRRDHRLQA